MTAKINGLQQKPNNNENQISSSSANIMPNLGGGLTFGGIPFGKMKKIKDDSVIDKELFSQVCLMTRLSPSTPRITPLAYDGKLSEWSSLMRSNLAAQGVLCFIINKFTDEVKEMPEFELVDRQVKSQIIANLHPNALNIVARATTARDCWELLDSHYQNSRGIQAMRAINQLHEIRDAKIENIKELVKQFDLFLHEIEQALGEQKSEVWHELWSNYFYTLVPAKYNYMIGDVKDKFDSVHKMLNHFKCEELLAAKSNKNFQLSNLNNESKLKHPDRYCDHCQKPGHTKENCFKLRRKRREQSESNSESGGGQSTDGEQQTKKLANLQVAKQASMYGGLRIWNGCMRIDANDLSKMQLNKDHTLDALQPSNQSNSTKSADSANVIEPNSKAANATERANANLKEPDICASTANPFSGRIAERADRKSDNECKADPIAANLPSEIWSSAIEAVNQLDKRISSSTFNQSQFESNDSKPNIDTLQEIWKSSDPNNPASPIEREKAEDQNFEANHSISVECRQSVENETSEIAAQWSNHVNGKLSDSQEDSQIVSQPEANHPADEDEFHRFNLESNGCVEQEHQDEKLNHRTEISNSPNDCNPISILSAIVVHSA